MRRQLSLWLIIFAGCLFITQAHVSHQRDKSDGSYLVAYADTLRLGNSGYTSTLRIMLPDGSAHRTIATNDTADSVKPEWERQGIKLYFTHSSNSQRSLYAYDIMGSKSPQLLMANATSPNISPDGKYLIYTRDNHLEVILRETEELVMETVAAPDSLLSAIPEYLMWFPDSQSFLYYDIERSNNNYEICMYRIFINLQEVQPLDFCAEQDNLAYGASLSPDGQWLAIYSQNNDQTLRPIRLLNMISGEEHELLNHTSTFNTKGWSPDSRWFASWGERILYIYDVQTEQTNQIPINDEIWNISWAPDGSGFYYSQHDVPTFSLYWRDAHGQNPKPLAQGDANRAYTEMAIPSSLFSLTWHPRYLALLGGLLFICSVGLQVAINGQDASKP